MTGLYATVVPLLAYALFGPSKILVLGPDSSLAPIIAASIIPLAGDDPDRAIALAGLLAILMGALLILGGFLRLGFVTDLLSKPIRIGYLNGIALVVLVGQLPKLLGFSVDADSLIGEITAHRAGRGRRRGEHHGAGGRAGLARRDHRARGCCTRRCRGCSSSVVGAIVVTAWLGLEDQLPVVGALPQGLPTPALGGLQLGDVAALIGPAAGIALIAFADTGVLSRTFAARSGETVDGQRRDARHRRCERRHRVPERVPDLGELLPHAGRRPGGREEPARRRGRRRA